MKTRRRVVLVALVLMVLVLPTQAASANSGDRPADVDASRYAGRLEGQAKLTLIGRVVNTQEAPVHEAEVRVFIGGVERTLTVAGEEVEAAHTDAQGFYIVDLALPPAVIEGDAIAV
jgi:hypothetical protein